MLIVVLFALVLSIFLISLNCFLSMKKSTNREMVTPFECGFDPKSSARLPFSLNFFLLAIIFLIFDVEIAIILPVPLVMGTMSLKGWALLSVGFIMVLILGTLHEWNKGALDWSH